MKLKLHTKGIKGSAMVPAGEEPGVLFGVVVEVDGEILLTADKVELSLGEKILTATMEMAPSSVEIIGHDEDSWKEFNERVDVVWRAATARTGMGQAIAKHPEDVDEPANQD